MFHTAYTSKHQTNFVQSLVSSVTSSPISVLESLGCMWQPDRLVQAQVYIVRLQGPDESGHTETLHTDFFNSIQSDLCILRNISFIQLFEFK
jgi:hypothetical protein